MIILSACLAGHKCRYDGEDKLRQDLADLVAKGEAIALCPEEMGGLPTPRPPSEQRGEKVITCAGVDVTDAYNQGAHKALDEAISQALKSGKPIEKAILKTNSPMCGVGQIYDGSFSGQKIAGDGVFTKLLKEKAIKVEGRD